MTQTYPTIVSVRPLPTACGEKAPWEASTQDHNLRALADRARASQLPTGHALDPVAVTLPDGEVWNVSSENSGVVLALDVNADPFDRAICLVLAGLIFRNRSESPRKIALHIAERAATHVLDGSALRSQLRELDEAREITGSVVDGAWLLCCARLPSVARALAQEISSPVIRGMIADSLARAITWHLSEVEDLIYMTPYDHDALGLLVEMGDRLAWEKEHALYF